MIMSEKDMTTSQENTSGNITRAPITEEMKKSYLDYAMSVIVSRAIPDARDGLKPVQRRILYALHKLGLSSGSAHKKSARIVGETIGKYHPHGDAAVYDAMVRMAQDFSLRYPLVDGQGNFGSIDGDPAAAMRYTEARLAKIAEETLRDLNRYTVSYLPNFDASEEEPEVLPTRIANLLLNGADGIAVGMATKIPPHNLSEITDALVFVIDNLKLEPVDLDSTIIESDYVDPLLENETEGLPETIREELTNCVTAFTLDSDATVEDLMEFVKGPDFPTGGIIYNKKEIVQAYATGKGKITMRGRTRIEPGDHGRHSIIISEIPYQQNKAKLVSRIADLVKSDKLQDVSDVRDESDRRGLRVVVQLKTTANPQKSLNRLYKHTPLQSNYYANMVALVDGEPQLLTLKLALVEFLKHRKQIVIRRSIHELYQTLYRIHILEGLKTALDYLDEIIETIKKSPDTDTARENLMKQYDLTALQAQAILDMQLKRLAALERQKILDELEEKLEDSSQLKKRLGSPQEIMEVVREELEEIKEDYGDERLTEVKPGLPDEITEEDLVKEEETVIILSQSGYIKRVSPASFRTQSRGGKGVKAANLKKEDINQEVLACNTLDDILFFTNHGRVFSTKVYEIPKHSRSARGQAIINILPLDSGEKIASILTLHE